MKQKRNLMILGLIFGVLVIIYIGLSAKEQAAAKKESAKEEGSKIELTQADALTEFTYTNGTDTMGFVKKDGTWYYSEDQEIEISQDIISATADVITGLTAVRQLKEPDALKDYGLEEPLYTISGTDEKGKEVCIYIGNATGEDYYAATADKKEVYTITADLVNSLYFTLDEVVQEDSETAS